MISERKQESSSKYTPVTGDDIKRSGRRTTLHTELNGLQRAHTPA